MGAYSHLSSYANETISYDAAVSMLMDWYGRTGIFTPAVAKYVIDAFDRGRINESFANPVDGNETIDPPAGAINPGQNSQYQYDVSVEFNCYDVVDTVFVRVDSDGPLSANEIYGNALDAAFDRLSQPTLGGAGALEQCEPTGNYVLHAAYTMD
jgi:hypothetical protein